MNKRYNNVEMLQRNIERIHTAPYYAELARELIAQHREQQPGTTYGATAYWPVTDARRDN